MRQPGLSFNVFRLKPFGYTGEKKYRLKNIACKNVMEISSNFTVKFVYSEFDKYVYIFSSKFQIKLFTFIYRIFVQMTN